MSFERTLGDGLKCVRLTHQYELHTSGAAKMLHARVHDDYALSQESLDSVFLPTKVNNRLEQQRPIDTGVITKWLGGTASPIKGTEQIEQKSGLATPQENQVVKVTISGCGEPTPTASTLPNSSECSVQEDVGGVEMTSLAMSRAQTYPMRSIGNE